MMAAQHGQVMPPGMHHQNIQQLEILRAISQQNNMLQE
jgi:hypothetical protein|tara:strand:- start:201 stop:314 length:114 start_codon:yes stop_codon:yes gene_type:complete